jgi:hypothetical protein
MSAWLSIMKCGYMKYGEATPSISYELLRKLIRQWLYLDARIAKLNL